MNATGVRVAELATEYRMEVDAGAPEQGWRGAMSLESAPLTARPAKVRLDNDGMHEWWVEPGAVWTLAYDGVGWRAQCPAWPSSLTHVMRLADAEKPYGSWVGALPLADGGTFTLVEGVTYQIRLGANADVTGSAIILSM